MAHPCQAYEDHSGSKVLFESSEPVANCPSRLRQSVRPKHIVKMSHFSLLDEYMSKWTNGKTKKKYCCKIYKMLISISCMLVLGPSKQ